MVQFHMFKLDVSLSSIFTFIFNCMGSYHGKILIETETDSLYGKGALFGAHLYVFSTLSWRHYNPGDNHCRVLTLLKPTMSVT